MTPDNTGYPPPAQPPQTDTGQGPEKLREKVILVSCFDGIGSAAVILKELVETVTLHLAWEIDEDCISVLKARHEDVMVRGDVLKDDPLEVARIIQRHDPGTECLVVFAAAPPCPDFSRIKENTPGSKGEEGQKFTAYCTFVQQIEKNIPHKKVGYLVENVVMQKTEADFFSERLNCEAVVADAQDFGLVNRPRLWWTRVDWSTTRNSPMTGERLKWSKTQKYYRLHMDAPLQESSELDLGGLRLHPQVTSHVKRMPCFTTPAPSEAGRSPPKKLRGRVDPEQRTRWLNDGRTFAPWQYTPEALMHSEDGTMTVPTPEVKEQLHMLPKGYTAVSSVSDRARHRMMANGWHLGSARFMMMLVLHAMVMTSTASPVPTPSQTALQQMAAIVKPMTPMLGPGRWSKEPACVAQASNMWEHWSIALTAAHPMQRPPHLEPGLQQCIQVQSIIGGSLPRMRAEIVDEINQMAEEQCEATAAWWKSLPPHIAMVYYDQEHAQVSQIPLLIQLLDMFQMPGLDELAEDLCQGFQVTGVLHQGAGWLPRADGRYDFPVNPETFRKHNRHYTEAKLRKRQVDPEWQTMLSELKTELQRGRMSGPNQAPSWWPTSTVGIDDMPTIPLPDNDISTSFCFSVKQTDKIRRCEDFRRSGHNATVMAHYTPHHHDIKTFTDLALAQTNANTKALVWAQDLNGAYRQFPVRNPSDCYCVLMTPKGPILMQHHAMTFGTVSSVWNFNRAADGLTFLSRRLLATSLGHYVDDFIGVEADTIVLSGFEQFTRLMRILGLRMKERKALPPRATQKVLGINMHVACDKVILAPHPDRCAKAKATMNKALQDNKMTQDEAHRLAGKLIFLTSTLFGQLGRAALQPLYARAHGLSDDSHIGQLNRPLRAALQTLIGLLEEVKPREIPRSLDRPHIILYSDAYFVLDGQRVSPGSASVPRQWHKTRCHTYENGWGCVIHFAGSTFFSAGRIPAWIIKKFCTRKAYIYFLEVIAQFLGMLMCRSLPSTLLTSFIDNTSGFFALRKGYCKDPAICNMIALVWRVIAHKGWHVHLEWVQSNLNISDAVSRQSFSDMQDIGATWIEMDTDSLYRILQRTAVDSSYAHGDALNDILALRSPLLHCSHTGGVGSWAPVWGERGTSCDSRLAELESVTKHPMAVEKQSSSRTQQSSSK